MEILRLKQQQQISKMLQLKEELEAEHSQKTL
jgi:hypothetical protein